MNLDKNKCTDDRWKNYHNALDAVKTEEFYKNEIMHRVVELNNTEPCLNYLQDDYTVEKEYLTKNFYEKNFLLKDSRMIFKNKLVHPHTERYLFQACLISRLFGTFENFDIIEIGSNYGGLCRILTLAEPTMHYTLVDHESMNRFSKFFLEFHNNKTWLEIDELEKAKDKKFSLFISNICLSETPKYFRDWLYENIIPNCEKCFIIDGIPPEEMKPELENMISDNYSYYNVINYIRENHFIFYGKK